MEFQKVVMICPSEAVVNRSRCSPSRATTVTVDPGRQVSPSTGNHMYQPVAESQNVLYTRLSVPTMNTSMWSLERATAVTVEPGDA